MCNSAKNLSLSLCSKGHDFSQRKLQVLYVLPSAQFPEVEKFVEEAESRYSLHLERIVGLGIRDALSQLKTSHPQFKAIMMGTRRSDPFSGIILSTRPLRTHVWAWNIICSILKAQ